MARNFLCNDVDTVVQTKAGKLKGFWVDGIYTFYGIKYADSKRWQMPTPVEPWDGIKTALAYGYASPMLHQDVPHGNDQMVPHRYWPMDENCQYLNVWTQRLDTEAKKPVMVWFHGGGYAAGSGIEQVCYEGDSMAKFGDVVMVTINHRLNILGYMDVSAFGEEYANSYNVGTADLVASLQWVHDNIIYFGGDPENVTIFGQSGGGSKVQSMLQTPAAAGLFHKAIVQSGVGDFPSPPVEYDGGKAIVAALLKEMGLEKFEDLVVADYADLADAFNKVAPEVTKSGFYAGGNGPLKNDWYLGDPRKDGFAEYGQSVPLMVGSVMGEMAFGPGVENKYDLTEEEIVAMIDAKYTNADAIVAAFKKAYPEKCLADALFYDLFTRPASIDFARKKAVYADKAPTYNYFFTYDFPYDSGHTAWHCSDLPFTFHNASRVPICNKPGVSDILEERMAGAWVAFARYGNPNHPGIPQWDAASDGVLPTMIFDENCRVMVNGDDELIEVLQNATVKDVGDRGHMLH